MTRTEIENLKVGDVVKRATQSKRGLPDFRTGKAERVVAISYRGVCVCVSGAAYVGGYTQFSRNGEMSFSVSEGEDWIVITDEAPAVLP